ncbi:hypothetical protein [Pseudarthrobacter sp. B4EP4b]|uniref:hypothetical protein n=1 Tax=Pseudarthrobacter sp. B4EP4b TaxID=2590664 RepID=UPI001152D012|nr:hypothetical protein [Pseudarthrobacter sp. B4EP4b]
MSTIKADEKPAPWLGQPTALVPKAPLLPELDSESWFKRFFGRSWWIIALWMISFCILLLLTLLVFHFLCGWLSQEWTWEGFGRFATSPFATAVGAIGAALIAGTAVVLTLNQNKNVEASKTWWETFEWATERAIPLKEENQALPYGTAIDILSPLMDDDFGGRRLGRRAAKSWELRKQACSSMIKLLNGPYTVAEPGDDREPTTIELGKKEFTGESRDAENTAVPDAGTTSERDAAGTTAESAIQASLELPRRRNFPDADDLESVQNFISAHPSSQAAKELSATHYESLLISRLRSLLAYDEEVDIIRNVSFSHTAGNKDVGRREADAIVLKGNKAVILEVKKAAHMPIGRFREILRREITAANTAWRRMQFPTLLVTDFASSDAEFQSLRREFSTPYFQVSRWTGDSREERSLVEAALDFLAAAPDERRG